MQQQRQHSRNFRTRKRRSSGSGSRRRPSMRRSMSSSARRACSKRLTCRQRTGKARRFVIWSPVPSGCSPPLPCPSCSKLPYRPPAHTADSPTTGMRVREDPHPCDQRSAHNNLPLMLTTAARSCACAAFSLPTREDPVAGEEQTAEHDHGGALLRGKGRRRRRSRWSYFFSAQMPGAHAIHFTALTHPPCRPPSGCR